MTTPVLERRTPRTRTRVLIIALAALIAIAGAAVVADGLVRSRIESALASAESPVALTLGPQPVLWSYLTGTIHVDVHVTAEQMRNAMSEKAGIPVGDITISNGTITAALDAGPMSAFLGGDVAVELLPTAVDGTLSLSVSEILVGGEARNAAPLANQVGPFTIDPTDIMSCAALSTVTITDVSTLDNTMVVSASVPRNITHDLAECS